MHERAPQKKHTHTFEFMAISGLVLNMPNETSPIDFTKLFLTDHFIKILVEKLKNIMLWRGRLKDTSTIKLFFARN